VVWILAWDVSWLCSVVLNGNIADEDPARIRVGTRSGIRRVRMSVTVWATITMYSSPEVQALESAYRVFTF
jgi:hypothetical protein